MLGRFCFVRKTSDSDSLSFYGVVFNHLGHFQKKFHISHISSLPRC